MIEKHRLDGPSQLEGDVSPDRPDQSELTFFYPEPKKDERPLIMSDEERHRQHDEGLADERGQLHREVWLVALFVVIPPAIIYITYTFFSTTITNNNLILFLPLAILAGVVTLVLFNWMYRHAADRIHQHGIHHASFIMADLLLIIGAVSAITWYFQLTVLTMKDAFMIAGIAVLMSVIVTKCLVIVATRRLWAPRQKH